MTVTLRLSLALALMLVPAYWLEAAGVWTASGPGGGNVSVLAVDPARPGVVYADAGGLFRSRDGGDSWSRLPLGASPVGAFAVLPGSGALLAAAGGSLYRSSDDGAHWTTTELAGAFGLVVSTSEIGTVYAVAGDVFRSTDGGVTWEVLPITVSGSPRSATSFAIDPAVPSTLYAVLSMVGAARSLDRGAHWELINTGLPSISPVTDLYSLAVDPNPPSTVYVGGYWHVYRSLDRGATWTAGEGGVGIQGEILRLSVDPVTSAVFASSARGTTYRSTDRGASWSALRIVPASGCTAPRSTSSTADRSCWCAAICGTR